MALTCNKNFIIGIVGWYGTCAIVAGYALVSFGVLDAKGVLYQLLNLTGALGLLVVTVRKRDAQPATLNLFWAAVALVALIRYFL